MVLHDLNGGERQGAGPQRGGEAGVRAGEGQWVWPGRVSQAAQLPEEQRRTGHSPGACKLGVNLSRETSRRTRKPSGARGVGRHQRRWLSRCQPKPCSASRSSSEVRDCSRDCGWRGEKNTSKVVRAAWLCPGRFAGRWLSPLLSGKVSAWLRLGKGGRTANRCLGA